MKRFIFLAACMVLSAVVLHPAHGQDIIGDMASLPAGSTTVIDDFEKGNYWIWAAFDWELYGPSKLSTSARLSNRWASQGRQSLECRMIASTPGSATDGMYYMDYHWDFSGSRYIVLDVYNPEDEPFDFGIALQATDEWRWDELSSVRVNPGWHTVVLDLSKFADDLFLIRRINICYREISPMDGRFYIDNLRIVK
ncbi:MAG TPA: hypothetical protein DDW78_03800 [Treponema sp.]|nr:hypothetical protein [Treponema sp.]